MILRLGQKETKKKHLKQQARHNLCQVIKLDDIKPRIDTTRFENGSELHTLKSEQDNDYEIKLRISLTSRSGCGFQISIL